MPNLKKLVCPACAVVNRVPQERFVDRPICGKCKQSLLPNLPIDLTDRDFSKYISRTEVPVLVDFWAPWCGPCKMMAPAFAESARTLSPHFILAKVNTEVAQETAASFQISSIPTMILFQSGRELARKSGAMNAAQIALWARQCIAHPHSSGRA